MEKKNNDKSGLPLVIIGAVLLLVIIGGWWFYSSSDSSGSNANRTTVRPTNVNAPANQAQSAPRTSTVQGAQPPHFKGAQNAPVVIEEFADFQCPTCATVHPMMNEITSTFGSRIKFIFRHYPLTQMHKNAYDAAVAAEAAGLQGKFWDMQNIIFQNQKTWSTAPNAPAMFENYAQTIGLNLEQYKDDVAGMRAKQRVDADLQRARSLNLDSTPSILINGRAVPPDQMSVEAMKQIISSEIAKMPDSPQTIPAAPAQPTGGNTAASDKGTDKKEAKPANK